MSEANYIDIPESSKADLPAVGKSRIVRAGGMLQRLESDGSGGMLSAFEAWLDRTQMRALSLASTLNAFDAIDFIRSNEFSTAGPNPPTQANSTGGVVTFPGAGIGEARISGSIKQVFSPNNTPWSIAVKVRPNTAPDATTATYYGILNDGVSSWVGVHLLGSGSTTVPVLEFNKAGSITTVNLNAAGTIGSGFVVNAWNDVQIVYDGSSTVTVLVNGIVACTRTDVANLPTVGLFADVFASGTPTMDLDSMFVAWKAQ